MFALIITIVSVFDYLFGDAVYNYIYTPKPTHTTTSKADAIPLSTSNPADSAVLEAEVGAIDVKELDEFIPMKALSMIYSPIKAINNLREDAAADVIGPPRPATDAPVHIWDLDEPEYKARNLATGARFEAQRRSRQIVREAKAKAAELASKPKPSAPTMRASQLEAAITTCRTRRSTLRECAYKSSETSSFIEALVESGCSPVTLVVEDFSDSEAGLFESTIEEDDWTPYYSRPTLAIPSALEAIRYADQIRLAEKMAGCEDEEFSDTVSVGSSVSWDDEEEEELESLDDLKS